ncbi:MAG: hypothetical protein LBT16_00370 [Treponema sp.]|jgi:hypothetical protein|nr:hypothetical protein [Treponema sp.]
MRKVFVLLFALTAGLLWVGAEESSGSALSIADKVNLELEFNASVLSVDTDGVVDSMTDAGFDEDAAKIGLSYEDELWGGTASLKFGQETLRIFHGEIGEMFAGNPLSIDELYVWVKPFGEHFKFTGGVFENTDGVADYTGDIDNFDMGVFVTGEGGEFFSEPEEMTNASLVNGFLTDAAFGPVTVQLLLAPNYSKESADELVSELLGGSLGVNERFFRIGGRVIADLGIGTLAAMVKTFQWPIEVINAVEQRTFGGTKANNTTFGAYFDFTKVENLGLSLGYTGFLFASDDSDTDSILWNGIDLRATWTGIEGLSISTHNNLSFAKGKEKEWSGMLAGNDASFLTLYNAIGITKELNEKFSVNAEVANIFSRTDNGNSGKIEFDNFCVGAKLISHITDNAEFTAGLKVDVIKNLLSGNYGDADDTLTVFSVPLGIAISF